MFFIIAVTNQKPARLPTKRSLMKIFSGKIGLILLLLSFLFFLTNKVVGQKISNPQSITSKSENRIDEKKFILINGIEQWVTIKGEITKPVILFLHGGPGSTLSPYADNVYSELEKEFLLVQWDQRGSGRTYGRNAPAEQTPEYFKANILTLDQMTGDGIALTEYLLQHLGKKKIILFGTSWGSILGVEMATKRPDLFQAYVGHSQIVSPAKTFIATYNKLLQMTQMANDTESIEILKSLGSPPYDSARNTGKLFRIIKKYERKIETPAPKSWFIPLPEYDNPKDDKHREEGDDYSFLNSAGDKKLGIPSMMDAVDFAKNNLNFKIPVYFIQGEGDILTPKELTREYFDKIKAPKKEYLLIPGSAHGYNQAILEAQYKIFRSIVK